MGEHKHYDAMLIDAKNVLYRSLFAGHADYKFAKSGYDLFVIYLRLLTHHVNKFRPASVHIFWDTPSDSVWRRSLYPAYKDNRDGLFKRYDFDIKGGLKRQMTLAIEVLSTLNMRQYYKTKMEADDLIYSFVVSNPDKSIIILSSDADFRQITYRHKNVDLFRPSISDDIDPMPEADPVIVKSLMGDKSDNISGYNQIGKVKAKALTLDKDAFIKFLASDKACVIKEEKKVVVGDAIFNLNKQLIDLSLCPYLDANSEYVKKKQTSAIEYNPTKFTEVAIKHKINGLLSEAPMLIPPFKSLV
jgi:5'-3' exonuclease